MQCPGVISYSHSRQRGRGSDHYIGFCCCSLSFVHPIQFINSFIQNSYNYHTTLPRLKITKLSNNNYNTDTQQATMSVNSNIDSVAQQGEFHARVPRDEPLTTKGVSFSPYHHPPLNHLQESSNSS